MIAPAAPGIGPAAPSRADAAVPRAWGALVAALAGMVVFAASLSNGFVYDDRAIVVGDPRVRAFDLGGILTGGYWPGEDILGLWRPLTTLSFARDWVLAPDNPAWFHLVNVLGHGAVCALVFLLLAMLFRPLPALLGALVFAVHPVHVEAVANVVGRAEVLAALLFLCAALLWLRTGEPPPADTPPPVRRVVGRGAPRLERPARLLLVPALYLLALLAKEGAVMLPAALVLLDAAAGRWRLRHTLAYLRRTWTAFTAQTVVLGAYLAARAAVLDGLAPTRVDPALEVTSGALERILTALQAWPHWARLFIWPRTLLADYGPHVIDPARTVTPLVAAGAIIVGILLGGGLYALARGRGRTALALLWVPVVGLPVTNFLVPIGVVVAERTLYLPSLALSLGGAGAAALLLRLPDRARRAGAVAFALAITLLALRTVTHVPVWSSNATLFAAMVNERPDSFRAHWNIARTVRAEGHVELALTEYGAAISLWPHRSGLVIEAAGYAARHGRLAYARQLAEHATEQWPELVDGHRVVAAMALALADSAAAERAVAAGLGLAPADSLLLDMRRQLDAAAPAAPPDTGTGGER